MKVQDKRNVRRVETSKRLSDQLKKGTKGNNVPLSEKDVERIKKELVTLKERIIN
jgi:uncharacterized protein YdcH (DUF465 family)